MSMTMLLAVRAAVSEPAFSPEVGIALVIVLVLANGFFVAAEFGWEQFAGGLGEGVRHDRDFSYRTLGDRTG